MTRHFCDACGKETLTLTPFAYANHIGIGDTSRSFVRMTADDDGSREVVPWNMREDRAMVCIRCYNQILETAYAKFSGIQEGNGVKRCHECGHEHREDGRSPRIGGCTREARVFQREREWAREDEEEDE